MREWLDQSPSNIWIFQLKVGFYCYSTLAALHLYNNREFLADFQLYKLIFQQLFTIYLPALYFILFCVHHISHSGERTPIDEVFLHKDRVKRGFMAATSTVLVFVLLLS